MHPNIGGHIHFALAEYFAELKPAVAA